MNFKREEIIQEMFVMVESSEYFDIEWIIV